MFSTDQDKEAELIGVKPRTNFNYEEAKYDGPPLIQPRTPYFVEYKPRMVDPSLPRGARIKAKTSNMVLDLQDYIKDILLLRTDHFSYKTAYFVKRNNHKMWHALHHIWDELKKVG